MQENSENNPSEKQMRLEVSLPGYVFDKSLMLIWGGAPNGCGPMTPNDPSSPTPPTATVERTENVGISEPTERKAEAAFGAAILLGDSFQSNNTKYPFSTVTSTKEDL